MEKITIAIVLKLLNWLSKRGSIPFRPSMGSSKNRVTIGRRFITNFITQNRTQIKGDILEIGREVYKNKIPEQNINSYTCLDIEEHPDVEIVADIQNMPQVGSGKFDTILCTQVLEHVPNPFLAANELHRVLKPGGRLIVTVPFLNNYHMEPHDYWRYTEYGLSNILKDFSSCKVESHGSTYHHLLATLGFCEAEMKFEVKERPGFPKFPVIVSAIAQK